MAKKIALVLCCTVLAGWHWFEPVARKNHLGLEAYSREKYDQALEQFLSAKGIKPDLARLKHNTALSLYQLGKYREALEEFAAVDPETMDIPPAGFHYNLGNSYYRAQMYEKALEAFKQSLLENPEDLETKINYELTLQKIREQRKNDHDRNQKPPDQEKEKDQPQTDSRSQHDHVMRFLNQKEREQLENRKRATTPVRKEKDW